MEQQQQKPQAGESAPGFDEIADHPEASKSNQNKPKESLFWRFKPREKAYNFHLVEKPVGYRQHWKAFKSIFKGPVISPAFYESEMDKDVAWSKGGYKPDLKYAGLAIDRDTGSLRILEAGNGVFKDIIDYHKACQADKCNVSVYGDNAPDWQVTVSTTVDKNGKERTEYKCRIKPPGMPVSLTQEEKDNIARFTAKVDWRKWYVRTTREFIQELYDKLSPELKINTEGKNKTASAKPAPLIAPVVSTPPASVPVVVTTAPAAAAPTPPVSAPASTPAPSTGWDPSSESNEVGDDAPPF